jgi:predicted dehydrogenase
MCERLGLGLIGCGVIAGTYLRELRRTEQTEWRLAAVCDTDAEKARAAAGDGAASYADLDRLLGDPAVDAVAVLLPNHLHAEVALRVLEAGKPVLVEKPMATTLEDCDRMIAAAERVKGLLMVGMTSRFCSSYRAARARLQAGEFGALNFIAEYCNYRIAPDWYIRPWLRRAETLGGGMFLQMGIHNLDRAVWLAGAEPLWAHAAIRNRSGVWADETGLATLGLDDGSLVQFQTDGLATKRRNETVLHCAEATVTVTQSRVVVHRQPAPEVAEFPADGFGTELREFAVAIRTAGPSPLGGGAGRTALALCLACYESSRLGATVHMDAPPWAGS